MLKQINEIEAESTTNQEMVPFRQPSDGYGPPNGGCNRMLGASGPPPVGCYGSVPYGAPQAFFAPDRFGVQPGGFYGPDAKYYIFQ
jgi:hypothetical protein